jgi:UTP--glucose-1-phosphate uridylyltransferase
MVRKALIPIAGKATRLMPITSVIPKAMFPLVNAENQIQCVLHVICEQVISAGISHIGIVVSPRQISIVRRYFSVICKGGFGKSPVHIEYITQKSPRGFGDAVLQGRDFIGEEPFMLLLGDHIYVQDDDQPPCAAQVARAFDSSNGVAMVGVQSVSTEELSRVGVAGGVHVKQNIYRCTNFIEKPAPATARQKLSTSGLPEDTFLAHCGIYVFSPEIFDCLLQISTTAKKAGKEIELADAQSALLKKYPEKYFLCKITGRAYDVGTPLGYVVAQAAFRNQKK